MLGIDSSAAQGIAKVKDMMHRQHDISLAIYVTGSEHGFPCAYNLSEDLRGPCLLSRMGNIANAVTNQACENPVKHSVDAEAEPLHKLSLALFELSTPTIPADYVCESLESALSFAEDVLIARENPRLLAPMDSVKSPASNVYGTVESDEVDEHDLVRKYIRNLCPVDDEKDLKVLISALQRETYTQGDTLWMQGSRSDSAKLVVRGSLLVLLEDEAGTTESVPSGAMVGELGLIRGIARFSTLVCNSEGAVLYSLSREAWEKLVKESPTVARCVDMIAIKYLADRVQHVSNRIFETRCLPV